MNILITGVSGFIGSELFKKLSWRGEKTSVYGINRSVESDNIFMVDLAERKAVESMIDTCKSKALSFDSLIHCAGILATSDNCRDIKLLYDNLKITENIILIASSLGIKNVIHLSTIGVYPNIDGIYDELSVTKPSSNAEGLYGVAKLTSENLFDFYLLPLHINVSHLRLAQVYGTEMRNDRIMKIMEAEMLTEGKISVWGNGERVSNFVFIDDVLTTIEHFINFPSPGIFNVGGKNLNYLELAELVTKMHNKAGVKILKVDKGVKAKVYINSDKLINLLKH